MNARWEYKVIEEGNPPALQERVQHAALEGWEPVGLGYAGECRLLALLKRMVQRPADAPSSTTAAKA